MRVSFIICPVALALSLALVLCFSPYSAQNQRPKVGLVLSGGGAKGVAHIGVLKAMEHQRIPDIKIQSYL